jgi:hypothetical protein
MRKFFTAEAQGRKDQKEYLANFFHVVLIGQAQMPESKTGFSSSVVVLLSIGGY